MEENTFRVCLQRQGDGGGRGESSEGQSPREVCSRRRWKDPSPRGGTVTDREGEAAFLSLRPRRSHVTGAHSVRRTRAGCGDGREARQGTAVAGHEQPSEAVMCAQPLIRVTKENHKCARDLTRPRGPGSRSLMEQADRSCTWHGVCGRGGVRGGQHKRRRPHQGPQQPSEGSGPPGPGPGSGVEGSREPPEPVGDPPLSPLQMQAKEVTTHCLLTKLRTNVQVVSSCSKRNCGIVLLNATPSAVVVRQRTYAVVAPSPS